MIDATNTLDQLGGVPSSSLVAQGLPGAKLVKGFNHLIALVLAEDPAVNGGRRVVFLSSDDESATAVVANLVELLGYAPIDLGKLAEGGRLVHGQDGKWGPLIFQDLFKRAQ